MNKRSVLSILALSIIMPLLAMAFLFTSCDMQDSTVGTFGDVADKVPNFSVIEGAENVTVRVERNNDRSYFNVNLSNIGENTTILDGNYLGWCAHWSAPIDTRRRPYDGITLYSTRGDRNWNKLNYVINNRNRYFNDIDGVTYKEIQAVIWTLIEFKEFDIDKNPVFDDLNRSAFNEVLSDVRENGDSFKHTSTTTHAVFADVSDEPTNDEPTQTVIVEESAWAYAGPPEESNSFRYHNIGNQWGWVMYYWFYRYDDETEKFEDKYSAEDPFKAKMYAGCGFGSLENPVPEDLESCVYVGDVDIWHDDAEDYLFIEIQNLPGNPMSESHVYVGTELPGQVAPGQFPYEEDPSDDGLEASYTIALSDFEDLEIPRFSHRVYSDDPLLYILIHSKVEVEREVE